VSTARISLAAGNSKRSAHGKLKNHLHLFFSPFSRTIPHNHPPTTLSCYVEVLSAPFQKFLPFCHKNFQFDSLECRLQLEIVGVFFFFFFSFERKMSLALRCPFSPAQNFPQVRDGSGWFGSFSPPQHMSFGCTSLPLFCALSSFERLLNIHSNIRPQKWVPATIWLLF